MLFALLLFALSAWQANRQVCPGCTSSDITLALADGTPIHARLYLPPLSVRRSSFNPQSEIRNPQFLQGSSNPQSAVRNPQSLPAVVVCHGYLANLAFMEIPWAADLTRLGLAVLFLDRRGHGRSGGLLWPRPASGRRLDDLEPDIAAAVAYLRAQPFVDPQRIGLLGHSDGATAAITAASADWDIRATAAVSASVAPWDLVNHVAPQNLLLVYGADDHFVLHDTDRALIGRGTRGYVAGPGDFGDLADGSARRLVRVARRGHLDVLYSEVTHREILEWLRRSLGADGPIIPSSARWIWVWAGVGAILIGFLPPVPLRSFLKSLAGQHSDGAAVGRGSLVSRSAPAARLPPSGLSFLGFSAALVVLALVWTAGLLHTPWLARHLQAFVPGQEGSVFASLLLGPAITLTAGALAVVAFHRLYSGPQRTGSLRCFSLARRKSVRVSAVAATVRGFTVASVLFGALKILLLHRYEVHLEAARVVLLLIFLASAIAAFAVLRLWLRWATGGRRFGPAASLLVLAAITALLSSWLFERMSMAPAYLVAAVLLGMSAYEAGQSMRRASGTVVFGGVSLAWLAAVVCALH